MISLLGTPQGQAAAQTIGGLTSAGGVCGNTALRDIDGIVDASAMQDYFVFTIVRNPWDRMVSYYHWAREQSFDHPVIRAAAEHDFAEFLHHPDVWRPYRRPRITVMCRGPSGSDHCNLYVRLEHLTSVLPHLRSIWGFALMWGMSMHLRVIRIIAHITQMIYAIMWRGYVQMISRDLSTLLKGCTLRAHLTRPTRRHRWVAPACPVGSSAALYCAEGLFFKPTVVSIKRRPEGRRFLGVLFGFLRRLLRQRQSDHKSFAPWQPCRVAGQGR